MSNQSLISTTSPSPPSWDVFLSFRGTDVRRSFISHLYFALDQAGIQTFRDEPALEKGQEISSALLAAIEDSKMYVVVLSENYAHSTWCLDELGHILSSKTTENQIVPVFYYVDPSDVRYLQKNYGTAFEKHEKRYAVGVINKWKSALAEISKLSGYHLRKEANQNESDIVQEMVRHVASQAFIKQLHLEEHLYGIDSAVKEIYQKLRMELNDVRVIGICGMGGIGKTTTAKAFYNQYSNRFNISCFIEDVKQYSQGGSPQLPLLQQLLSELRRRRDYEVSDVKTGIRQLQSILHSKKALIILDDLDKSSHLEWLARLCFSPGSRLVITTRDVNLLNQLKVDLSELEIYLVKKLEEEHSLELFSYHAFRKPMPPDDFRELSLSFVTYVEGLPLALKVLGASLRGRTDISFWKAKYEKVKQIPENEIHKILRLSYDELADEMQKAMFLDIVFFFIGKNKAEAIDIFRSCALFPEVGIPVLEDRFLISKGHMFEMHNLIEEMGREVIREESKHGNCRRLYLYQRNAYEALEYLEGHNKIEGLILKMTEWSNQRLTTNIFERMPNLKLLEIIGAPHIQGNFMNCFHELRCIRWHHCPWTQLPSDFRPQKLVSFDMQASKLKMLWKDVTLVGSLKSATMNYLKNLKRSPDIRDLKMVEKLVYRGYKSQKIFHASIGWLGGYVMNLKQYYLPKNNIKLLTNLSSLNLADCKNLKRLPEQLGDMKGLKMIDASVTAIEQLPDSIVHLKALGSLNLRECRKLRKLPEQFGNMEGLMSFDAEGSGIEELPDSIVHLKALGSLILSNCRKLRKLPEQFGNMEGLNIFDARNTAIEQLPDSIGQLINLFFLKLSHCKRLTGLPEQLGDMKGLHVIYASHTPIEQLPDSIVHLKALVSLNLRECRKLRKLPEQFGNMEGLMRFDASDSGIEELPDSIGQLIKLTHLDLRYCKRLTSVPDSICNLKLLPALDLSNCLKLERLPEQLGEMISLESIRVCDTAIQEIPDSIGRLSMLKTLDIRSCKKLKDVPNSIWNLTSLAWLWLPFGDIFTSNLPPDSVKDMKKLETLRLRCNIRLWLPMIQSLTSLKTLILSDEGKSLSSVKWFMNLSKLSNLEKLRLDNWDSSYLELPPSLTRLELRNNATVEQLPDLSNLEHLELLEIMNCTSLQSLPSLPLNLQSLFVDECTSLQSLPSFPLNLTSLSVDECTSLKDVLDVSILKKLNWLRIHHCSNLELINLKQRCLEVQRQPYIPPFSAQLPNKEIPEFPYFSAQLPNKEIPEWFDFKSNGSKICFNIPSSSSSSSSSVLGVKFVVIALWVVYKNEKPASSHGFMAVITNKTEAIEKKYSINISVGENEEVLSKVECISRHIISIKSGDTIEVEFQRSDTSKVLMCGAHIIIPETSSSTSPVSIN